jgi:NOL1/NOP2/sun family putative RNA methylase
MGSRDGEVTAELPPAFWERLESWVEPHRLPGVRDSFGQPKRVAFRVNRLSAEPGPVAAELERAGLELLPLPWLAEGFHVADRQRELLTRHPLVELGQIYIHNPSSMLATLVLAPQPGETVMDLAAAPGGKTLHMAAQMRGEGFLSAVEPVQSRFYKLKDNLRRGGASFVRTYQLDGRQVPRKTGPRFDRILLDAPCTATGTLRRRPDAAWAKREEDVTTLARIQARLLDAAFAMLKPGGRLVFCTCSLEREEGEDQIPAFLSRNPGAAIDPVRAEELPGLEDARAPEGWVRTRPDMWAEAGGLDGFFIARLVRTA